MSVESVSPQPKISKKRNNAGTFNVENPKKMKKVAKTSSQEDRLVKNKKNKSKGPLTTEGVVGMEPKLAAKKRKQSLSTENDSESPSEKKRKFLKNPTKTMHLKKPFTPGSKRFNDRNSAISTEKPDWNKLKGEKKVLRDKRRAAQKSADSFEVSIEAKKVLESVRSRKCPAAEQIKQLENLYSMLEGKLLAVVYAHDMSRVVETMMKMAHSHKKVDLLNKMIKELIPEVVEMSKKKYATHVVQTMIAHSQPSERARIVKAFNGHVIKLLSHKIGNGVLEQLHAKCKPEEQSQLQKELYGGAHKLISNQIVTGLEVIFENAPNMKASTLTNTKEILVGLLEKNAVQSRIVHAVILDYLGYATPEDSSELLDLARQNIKAFTQSKEGVHIAMMCVWMGSTKARKKIVKDLKGGVQTLANGEHTHMLLLAIFDCVDDAVIVQKAILGELLEGDLTPLLNSTYGRKVLMYICSRRNPKMFSAPVVATLATGDNNPHSKKDVDVRAAELQKFAIPLILESIAKNTTLWVENNSNLLVLLEALKIGSGDQLKEALTAVAKYVANPPNSKHMGIDLRVADNNGCHMVLKKLAQHDKVFVENGLATFGEALVAELTTQHYLAWLQNNHCCFLLLEVLKNGADKVVKSLKSKIKATSATAWQNELDLTAGGKRVQEIL